MKLASRPVLGHIQRKWNGWLNNSITLVFLSQQWQYRWSWASERFFPGGSTRGFFQNFSRGWAKMV